MLNIDRPGTYLTFQIQGPARSRRARVAARVGSLPIDAQMERQGDPYVFSTQAGEVPISARQLSHVDPATRSHACEI